jgi:hypothetical protein
MSEKLALTGFAELHANVGFCQFPVQNLPVQTQPEQSSPISSVYTAYTQR